MGTIDKSEFLRARNRAGARVARGREKMLAGHPDLLAAERQLAEAMIGAYVVEALTERYPVGLTEDAVERLHTLLRSVAGVTS